MSKNLTTALQKGNIKPKERVMLLVHDAVKKEMTGKGVLSDAEKHAISDGWQPLNNEQVREYNRYNQGWKLAGFAELDAQTAFLDMQVIFYREQQASWHLLSYPLYREAKKWLDRLDTIRPVTIDQAIETVKKQREVKLKGGMDFDRAVYELAYELCDKTLQEDLKILWDEVATDTQYLDQEEELYNLLKGKDSPTPEDKDRLAERIVKSAYNSYAKEWQLWHFYASIPIKEVGSRWLKKRGITPQMPSEYGFDDTFEKAREEVQKVRKTKLSREEALAEYTAENINYAINEYAKAHQTTVETELREVVREWLDNGLLTDHEPLFKSTKHNTYNGDTKLPHAEIFKEWLSAKARARETLNNLIKDGKLEVRDRTGGETAGEVWASGGKRDDTEGRVITGESIYAFKGDYKFIKEQNEYVDRYDANLGIVYADDNPDHKGQHLDRELLITDLNKEGKPHAINFSQMAIHRIKSYFDLLGFVEEKEVNGERIVGFSDDAKVYGELMQNMTEGLKKYYGILITFRELFKRLSKTYDIDLTYKINKWIADAEGFIDHHNFRIRQATKKDFDEIKDHKTVRLNNDLLIDKDQIPPDQERVVGYFKELEEALGGDF